jgi:hypothetical protein
MIDNAASTNTTELFISADPFILGEPADERGSRSTGVVYAQVERMSSADRPTIAEERTHAAWAPHTRRRKTTQRRSSRG